MSYWLLSCTNEEACTLPCFITCENLTQQWIRCSSSITNICPTTQRAKKQRGGFIRSVCGAIVTQNVPFYWLHLQDSSDLKQTG